MTSESAEKMVNALMNLCVEHERCSHRYAIEEEMELRYNAHDLRDRIVAAMVRATR